MHRMYVSGFPRIGSATEEVEVQGGDGGCDDGPGGDAPDPPRPGPELLGVPLRGAREPGGGVQDGSAGVRGRHR